MGVQEKDMKLLWLDLETTGLEKEVDEILEVAVCVTNWAFEPLDSGFTTVVEPLNPNWLELMDPFAREMHEKSGLLEDLLHNPHPVDSAEAGVLRYAAHHGCKRGETMMAGSGVSRYDLRFLERRMPDLANLLHYRQLDISPIRSFLLGTGMDHLLPGDESRAHRDNRKHRALDDVMDSIAEAAHYLDVAYTATNV